MNIVKIIKRILKIKSKENSLVNNIDIAIIPTRKFFKDSKKIIDLIESYKNEYRKILKKRIFTSIDLKLDDSINQMNMNIELLLNQCLNDKNKDNIYEDVEDELKDFVIETNNLTSLAKLKLYQDEIQKLELINICKVIALNELSKEIKYNLSLNKRNSIKNELSNLVNIMIIYKSQRISINLEIDNYKKDIEVINYDNYRRRDRKYKNKRFDNADKYIFVLSEEYRLIYNEYYLSVPEFTAIIERALEIYVYEHKDLLEKCKDELENLEKEEKQLGNKQRFITKIDKIKYLFRLFDLYGYNLVKDEDFDKLYRTKFDILTIDINNLHDSPFNTIQLENLELKVYEDIISKKIHDIYNLNCIEGKKLLNIYSDHLNSRELKKVNDSKVKIIGNILDSLLKTGKYFDYEEILETHMLIALILAFEKENGIKKFFEEFKEYRSKYHNGFYYRVGMYFEEKIPLETFCKVLTSVCDAGEVKNASLSYDIYSLDCLREIMCKEDIKSIYKIPDGIKGISDSGKDNHPFLLTMRKDLENKVKDQDDICVVFPSTLRYIEGSIFETIKLKMLKFNEGLEHIDGFAFYNQDACKVVIPSTLEDINIETFNWEKINDLEFTNFKNSKTLKKLLCSNDNQYKEILKKLFKVERNFYHEAKVFKGNIVLRLHDELGQKSVVWAFNRYSRDIRRQDLMLIKNDIEFIRKYLINLIYEETGYKIEPINEEKSKILKNKFILKQE